MTYLLLAASFALILGGALFFTNAVEWAGHRLELGTGAVGSILAAVATAMPESMIPIIAIISGAEGSADVAVGSIIGAPFMLATIAMMLVGIAAYGFRGTREQDEAIRAHEPTLRRDLAFFVVVFSAALVIGVVSVPGWLKWLLAAAFVAAYLVYLVWSLVQSGEQQEEEELSPLYFDLSKDDPPNWFETGFQLAASIGAIVYGAHLFVEEITTISERLGVPVLILALIIAPLATELPEKVNSFIWMRDGKDSLALGNITGAMMFQSSVPVAVGIAFTSWDFSRYAIAASIAAVVGGGVAMWAGLRLERFGKRAIAVWGALFFGFVAYAIVGIAVL